MRDVPGPIVIAVARAAGADPAVFLPVARAQALLVRRRAGLLRTRRGVVASWSPFRALCLFALLYGCAGLMFVLSAKSRIFGEALALTIGCLFLLMVVVSDYFDVLVNPREQLVLGSHPHDDRSILLAKLWTVGRALAILCLLLFAPTTIAVFAMEKSVVAAALYFAGSAGAAAAAAVAGLYAAVLVLSVFGRAAYDRMMPWLQTGFQISYFVFFGGQTFIRALRQAVIPPLVAWLAPPLWFLAPLEGFTAGWTPAVAGRAVLAAAVLGGLFLGGTRWLGARVGEKLLEPVGRGRSRAPSDPATSRARAAARARRESRLPRLLFGVEGARFFRIFRIHLRSDWRTRSEFFMGPAISAFLLLSLHRERSPWFGMFFIGCFLIASMDVLTRTARPESLWCVLVAPLDRARFSASAVGLLRATQLLPMVAVLAVLTSKDPAAGGWRQVVFLAEALLFGDLLILLGRALFPEFPFSRPSRADATTGRRMVLILCGTLLSGILTGGMYLADRFVPHGGWLAIAVLVALRFPLGWWMRRRVGEAAETIELAAGSVA